MAKSKEQTSQRNLVIEGFLEIVTSPNPWVEPPRERGPRNVEQPGGIPPKTMPKHVLAGAPVVTGAPLPLLSRTKKGSFPRHERKGLKAPVNSASTLGQMVAGEKGVKGQGT